MQREELGDLMAFLAVAEEESFTKAAARLGTSQSSLSLIIKRLEARLGVRLLTRTTRSVAPTAAGEQLFSTLAPAFGTIEAQLSALSEFRDKPAGSFRITAGQHAIFTIIWPKLSAFLVDYPDIKVELVAESALTDIVAERFDAGVRLGDQVEKDMIAVRIGPPARMIVVGAPSCFRAQPPPKTPQELTAYRCINLRLPSYGGFLCVGVRTRRRRSPGKGGWSGGVQRRAAGRGSCPGRIRPHLCSRRRRSGVSR